MRLSGEVGTTETPHLGDENSWCMWDPNGFDTWALKPGMRYLHRHQVCAPVAELHEHPGLGQRLQTVRDELLLIQGSLGIHSHRQRATAITEYDHLRACATQLSTWNTV